MSKTKCSKEYLLKESLRNTYPYGMLSRMCRRKLLDTIPAQKYQVHHYQAGLCTCCGKTWHAEQRGKRQDTKISGLHWLSCILVHWWKIPSLIIIQRGMSYYANFHQRKAVWVHSGGVHIVYKAQLDSPSVIYINPAHWGSMREKGWLYYSISLRGVPNERSWLVLFEAGVNFGIR